eukprot:UN04503
MYNNLPQFAAKKSKKKKKNIKSEVVENINKTEWINACHKSWNNVPVIPIVVYENTKYWIEWIKLVYINCCNSYVGVSFVRDYDRNNVWSVKAIYLDKDDILNKHNLCRSSAGNCNEYFEKFHMSLAQIKWQ